MSDELAKLYKKRAEERKRQTLDKIAQVKEKFTQKRLEKREKEHQEEEKKKPINDFIKKSQETKDDNFMKDFYQEIGTLSNQNIHVTRGGAKISKTLHENIEKRKADEEAAKRKKDTKPDIDSVNAVDYLFNMIEDHTTRKRLKMDKKFEKKLDKDIKKELKNAIKDDPDPGMIGPPVAPIQIKPTNDNEIKITKPKENLIKIEKPTTVAKAINEDKPKRDTPQYAQLTRLNRPGSAYFNLNPYDVLELEYDAKKEDIPKAYRRLARFVHPDKNPDDRDLAEHATNAINKAYKTLQNPVGLKGCREIMNEAKTRVDKRVAETKLDLKKKKKDQKVPEDDNKVYRTEIHKTTCKLFADLEKIRQNKMVREANDRRKYAEQEESERIDEVEKRIFDKEFNETRGKRVYRWRSWNTDQGKSAMGSFRPPKTKMEKKK
ncbi:Splicing protein spf31 [Intoshia linei]|uniref:Splicing protein spf31 n=1 Tax=Intoshia linei TaxID=1819745 RepID=A0A177B3Q9_9BILA|nr:Splicing protein spf31 [Intoshia linei]